MYVYVFRPVCLCVHVGAGACMCVCTCLHACKCVHIHMFFTFVYKNYFFFKIITSFPTSIFFLQSFTLLLLPIFNFWDSLYMMSKSRRFLCLCLCSTKLTGMWLCVWLYTGVMFLWLVLQALQLNLLHSQTFSLFLHRI